jgi:hypothetical protein
MDKSIFTPEQHEALRAILERYGSSLESFLDLRPDSYEHAIARHSLEHLEQLYATCVTPGLKDEELPDFCPPWPQGTPWAGKLPAASTVGKIAQRLRTEGALNSLTVASNIMEKFRQKAATAPFAPSGAVLDTLVNFLGQEVLEARLQGMKVGGNLNQLDRLITVQMAKDTGKREDKKLAQKDRDQQRKDIEVKLALEKFERESCVLFIKWSKDERAREIANGNLSNEEKIKQLRLTFFADVDALEQSGKVELPPLS